MFGKYPEEKELIEEAKTLEDLNDMSKEMKELKSIDEKTEDSIMESPVEEDLKNCQLNN